MAYEERTYRKMVKGDDLVKFSVLEKETDLLVLADKNLHKEALESVIKIRTVLEAYVAKDDKFLKTLRPHYVGLRAPKIVKEMAWAGRRARVGPMAAVAGAIAEHVGKDLLKHSKEVIVENGGDIFMKINRPRRVAIHAGSSPFSEKIAIEVEPEQTPFGICTSAGTVGHSLSFGSADAVVVMAKSAALADAAATAIGNVVGSINDIEGGLNMAKRVRGIKSVLIIKEDHIGAWGKMKIVAI